MNNIGPKISMAMLFSVLVDRIEKRIETNDLADGPIAMIRRELDLLETEMLEAKAKFEALSPEAQAATIQDMQDSLLESVGAAPSKPRGELQ